MTNLENDLQNFKNKIQTANQLIEELEQSNRNSTEVLKRLEDIDTLTKSFDSNSRNLLEAVENRFVQLNEETKNETNKKLEELRNLASDIDNRYKDVLINMETNTKETNTSLEKTYKTLIDDTNESFNKSTIGLEKEVNFTRETLRNLVSLYENSNRSILEIQSKISSFNALINDKIDKLEKKFTTLVLVIGIVNITVLVLSLLIYSK